MEDWDGRTYGLTTLTDKTFQTNGQDGTEYNRKTEVSVVGMTKFFYHHPDSYTLEQQL